MLVFLIEEWQCKNKIRDFWFGALTIKRLLDSVFAQITDFGKEGRVNVWNLVLHVVPFLTFCTTWDSIATKQVAGLVIVVSIVDQTLAVFVQKIVNVSCRGRKRTDKFADVS